MNRTMPAGALDAFVDGNQSETLFGVGQKRVEATAGINHLDLQAAGNSPQGHLNVFCLGVCKDIVERLLYQPVYAQRRIVRYVFRHVPMVENSCNSSHLGELAAQ